MESEGCMIVMEVWDERKGGWDGKEGWDEKMRVE